MCETHRNVGSKQELRVEKQQWQPNLGGGAAVLEPTLRDTRSESMRLLGDGSEEIVVPGTPKPNVPQKSVPAIEAAPVPAAQPVQQVAAPAPQAPAKPEPQAVKAAVAVQTQAAPYAEPKPKEMLPLNAVDSLKVIGIVSRLDAQLRRTPTHQSKNRRGAKEQAVTDICATAGLTVSGASGFAMAMGVLKRAQNGAEAMKLFQQLMSKQ